MVSDQNLTVDDQLVPGRQREDIAKHDIFECQLDWRGVSDRVGRRSGQDGQVLKGASGPELLADTDGCVDSEHHAEKPVLYRPDDRDNH